MNSPAFISCCLVVSLNIVLDLSLCLCLFPVLWVLFSDYLEFLPHWTPLWCSTLFRPVNIFLILFQPGDFSLPDSDLVHAQTSLRTSTLAWTPLPSIPVSSTLPASLHPTQSKGSSVSASWSLIVWSPFRHLSNTPVCSGDSEHSVINSSYHITDPLLIKGIIFWDLNVWSFNWVQ